MRRSNKIVIILSVSLVVLSVAWLTARPLSTSTYVRGIVKFLSGISKPDMVQKVIEHYPRHLEGLVSKEIGPYKDLMSSSDKEVYLAVAGLIFSGLVALFVSLVSLVLFTIYAVKREERGVSRVAFFLIIMLIILNGTTIRLILASVCYGNYDMQSYEIVSDIVTKGGNVYAETDRYNYSPLWFMVLGILKRIQLQFPALSLHSIVRSFLCGIDLLILMFLLLIAKCENRSLSKTALFFYLNPVSFLMTGYHGQFENLAILMVLMGLFAYLKLKSRKALGTAALWIFATIGMIVKHNIFYEVIICLNSAIKNYVIKLILFVISVCVFLALFIPYWYGGSQGIVKNVFMYSSIVGRYGITSLFDFSPLKYLFIVGMFIFPLFLESKDIIRECLLGILFFLVFTTGIGIQYLVLPIALGALRPSKEFLFYSLVCSVFILGSRGNVFLPVFHLFKWNIVWIGAIFWFAAELSNNKQPKKLSRTLKEKASAVWAMKSMRKKK